MCMSGSFMVSGLQVLNPLLVGFCVQCKIAVQFHPLARGCQGLSLFCCCCLTLFTEETGLSPLYVLGSFVVSSLSIYAWVCFRLCSVALVYVSVFYDSSLMF